MKKIPTVYVRDANDRRHVTSEVNPGCEWVFAGEGVATRKYDGTCVMLDEDGDWWARREVKPGKAAPDGFVLAQHDEVTGKTVGWEPMVQSSFAKFHDEALGNPYERRAVGTYELIGPKINGNPEHAVGHELVPHDDADILFPPLEHEQLKAFLLDQPYEGIVWHHPDGRMAKLKRRDVQK